MQIAIVGLAGSGKTTVFNTLTRGHAETGGYGGADAERRRRQGARRAPRPPRRDLQAEEGRPRRRHLRRPAGAARRRPRATSGPRSCRPSTWPGCASPTRSSTSSGRSTTRRCRTPRVRSIRRATSSGSTSSSSSPTSRWSTGGSSGSRTGGRHGTPAERESNEREEVVLRAAQGRARGGPADPRRRALRRRGQGRPRVPLPDREAGARAAQRRRGRDARRAPALVGRIGGGYDHRQAMVDFLSAKIEMELGELEPEDAATFMEELGIAESGLERVIRLSYRLLGLISFLTAGPDEVRAWPIPDGSTAVDAAGAIHTDLAKGFIRAETVGYEDLVTARLDGRGAQGRPAALGGEDLPRRRRRRHRDPVQSLRWRDRLPGGPTSASRRCCGRGLEVRSGSNSARSVRNSADSAISSSSRDQAVLLLVRRDVDRRATAGRRTRR